MKIKLVIIVLLLLLCGCSSHESNNTSYSCTLPIKYYSMDEYYNFIETCTLPANFVFYDDIKELGTFHCLWFYTDYSYNIKSISYELIDENGCKIRLGFSLINDLPSQKETLSSYSDRYGVRRLSTKESGTLVRDQISYYYKDGNLYSINFSASGRSCTLHLMKGTTIVDFSAYPTDGANTFTAKLLSRNPEDAQAAVDALCRNIPPTIEIICTWLIVGLLIAAAGVSTFLLLRRKKKGTIPPTKVSNDYTAEIIEGN